MLVAGLAFARDGDGPEALSGRLAYSRLTDGTWQIWDADLGSGARRRLTDGPGDKRYPAWLADGSLAFHTSNLAAWRLLPDGGAASPFLEPLWPVRDLAWSPDGRRLAFARFRHEPIDSANIWIAGPDGAEARMLTDQPGIQFNPAWAPDGAHVAYSAGQGPGSYDVYVAPADGGAARRVSWEGSLEFLPAWSPDGQWLAFSSDRSGDYEIWLARPDGADARRLTRSPGLDTRPAWSPDGQWLAFATRRSGAMEVWVMRADGSGSRLVEPGEAGDPAWRR